MTIISILGQPGNNLSLNSDSNINLKKQDVRVDFSVTRMRSSNSAYMNKSDFTTKKIV